MTNEQYQKMLKLAAEIENSLTPEQQDAAVNVCRMYDNPNQCVFRSLMPSQTERIGVAETIEALIKKGALYREELTHAIGWTNAGCAAFQRVYRKRQNQPANQEEGNE
ncbi:hypothetical protein KS4_23540 [Poriferisphaera corsica]|uniref:Uncharacterized protein n=1 Tax=Poriferisphaera corsica TaxID=2528020 RepID=A0A517YVM8_9BACT|nr:hypothetical protein [Poriferisphaera corsica]QDU34287.1 hypothetical protein KS4_23540 [Poriferisphaera corsica]